MGSPMKGAYWSEWSDKDFPAEAIETSYFTHIYYAFLSPDEKNFKLYIDSKSTEKLRNFTSTLHAKNPSVKTLFSIGGWSERCCKIFSRMALKSKSREIFIDSTIEVARKFGFDGIDLDWEFPKTPDDMVNFGLLLDEWRAAVEREAAARNRPQLLLAAAVYYSPINYMYEVPVTYPGASITKNLDWINVMTYNYYGNWKPQVTGAHAALYNEFEERKSTSYGLNSWIEAGVPQKKLVMGLPLYGRTWKLTDRKQNGIGAPARGVGPGDEEGYLKFSEVVKYNMENNATVAYDAASGSTYSYTETTWIGYDDIESTTQKIRHARSLGLGGYFFWPVDGDHEWRISKAASQLWN